MSIKIPFLYFIMELVPWFHEIDKSNVTSSFRGNRKCSVRLNKNPLKIKSDDEEILESSRSFVQAEKRENNENTLNIESISKSENLAKSSIVIKPRHLKYPVLINMEKKLDMILSKISKLNSKLPDEIKPHSQAN